MTRQHLSKEWYRQMLLSHPDDDQVLIGHATFGASSHDPLAVRARCSESAALSLLVTMERNRRRLSMAQLADRLSIQEDDVRQIEEASGRPRPRTLQKFAEFLNVPLKQLAQLAGLATVRDSVLCDEALRFAAHSDSANLLHAGDVELLKQFVGFLRLRADKDSP
jgi:transcriptional regulator with XRE-family HTH domain